MALAKRNDALSPPPPPAPLSILEQKWFQWTTGVVATLSPLAVMIAVLAHNGVVPIISIPNVFIGLVTLLNGYLLYTAMKNFDGAAPWSLRWALGSYMKAMAIAHAAGAMYLAAQTRDGLTLSDVTLSSGIIWFVVGLWWVIAAVAFLVGDAHIRINQRFVSI